MGQRLIVKIADNFKNPTKTAMIYYHWSDYFVQAIAEVNNVCSAIKRAEKNNGDIILAIERMLEMRGGGVRGTDEDLRCFEDLYPKEKFSWGSRDNGIITLLPKGFESYEYWGEGGASIQLSTRKVRICVSDEYPNEMIFPDKKHKEFKCILREHGNDAVIKLPDLTIETMDDLYSFVSEHIENMQKDKEAGVNALDFVKNNMDVLLGCDTID